VGRDKQGNLPLSHCERKGDAPGPLTELVIDALELHALTAKKQ
jgi:hypothetical protein